jgi:hypothetical protein
MNPYDNEYFFISSADDESLPSLTATDETIEESYGYYHGEKPTDSPTLVFFNGAKDWQRKRGISVSQIIPDILFDGKNLVVRSKTRDAIVGLDIPGLATYPCVYYHNDRKKHDDFWYLAFSDKFDSWDRIASEYEMDTDPCVSGSGEILHQVYSMSLNKKLLDSVPVQKRLLFKMGGCLGAYIVCHASLLDIFSSSLNSLKFVRVSDY